MRAGFISPYFTRKLAKMSIVVEGKNRDASSRTQILRCRAMYSQYAWQADQWPRQSH